MDGQLNGGWLLVYLGLTNGHDLFDVFGTQLIDSVTLLGFVNFCRRFARPHHVLHLDKKNQLIAGGI
jgi:hypothetical protein